METRDEHYASIRRSRGASFGKNVGKVTIIRNKIGSDLKSMFFEDRGWVSLYDQETKDEKQKAGARGHFESQNRISPI